MASESVPVEPDSSHLPDPLIHWLQDALSNDASDLHLVPGYAPTIRRHGLLKPLDFPVLSGQDVERNVAFLFPDGNAAATDLDLSVELELADGLTRFRVNLFVADGHRGACFRVIPDQIPTAEWAGIPDAVMDRLSGFRDGLVVVTGPTGAGKTTTLAIIVEQFNRNGGRRVITVEEPIEYRFPVHPGSVITQREVGTDVTSFASGLRSGLRQDPDAILVGEIRDRETAQMALSAAETGHLVLTTLHARDSKGAISRLADLFPQEVQATIRNQLTMGLRAVLCQQLLPDVIPGSRRHLALEVLWNTSPIQSAIRSGKLESIDNYLLTGRESGMISLDESVRRLNRDGFISDGTARRFVRDPEMLKR